MLKSALLKKTVCLTTVFSFAFANLPGTVYAYGYRLTPESFEEMYALAQNGRVEALRSSINRGLNIDVMNSNGDTGLCVAARRHDSYTYNAFRAAGANPYHPCTQNISDYEHFINSSRAVSVTSTPRAAYSKIGHEEYSLSPNIWWWIGGAALIGGGIALALGGGGGGGNGSSGGGDDPDTEDYNSLGALAGSEGTVLSSISGISSNNSTYYNAKNSKTEQISKIDLNSNILENTQYLDVVLNAKDGGKYTNTKDTVLKMGEGMVGMSAVKDSQINNFGFINIESYNASIGMIASEGSTAVNWGRGIIPSEEELSNNGIALNFSGYDTSHALIGMYADTKSIIQNYGDIKGTAIKASQETEEESSSGLVDTNIGDERISATSGALVGMEAMIVNAGKDLNKDTIQVLNESSGKITLSAGDSGATEENITISMTGIGSYLDIGFMDGSKNINRAESVVLRNMGDITLSYTGNYTPPSDSSLRKGTGGIVGMRADAKTSAYNYKNINLNLDEYSEGSSSIDVSAGMQSIHGAHLYNYGDIKITTSAGNARKNYGMLSVEGSGSVSGLYTDLNQNIVNYGNISVQASNSFGIASFNGGTLKNNQNIVLGKPETTTLYQRNIAMYGYGKSKETTMENTGTIDIYSHDSIAMQNDFAGGTSIYNKGTINVYESATNSYVFGGAYSEAHNSKIINYYANSSGTSSSDGETYNPFANYTLSIGNSIISTQARSVLEESSSYTSSTTEKIYNDENSVINMSGSSFVAALTVEPSGEDSGETQGKAFNNGIINITDSLYQNATNTLGMYLAEGALSNAYIVNNGSIKTDSRFSAAMASNSKANSSMINNGYITTERKNSLGMASFGVSNILNNQNISMNGDDSVAVLIKDLLDTRQSTYFKNSSDGIITVGNSEKKTENSFGIFVSNNDEGSTNLTKVTMENEGILNIYTKEAGAGIYSLGDAKINNKNEINIFGDKAYGIYAENSANIINDVNGIINVGTAADSVSESYGIYNTAYGKISNKGTINLYNDENTKGYAIYSFCEDSVDNEITNEGVINLNNKNSTAIYAKNGKIINKKDININHDSNNALESSTATVINESGAVINVGSESNAVSGSNGMYSGKEGESEASGGTLINNGIINLYSVGNGESHAVSINEESIFNNTNLIKSYNDNSTAILATAAATINNSGEITVEGTNVYAVKSTYEQKDESSSTGLTLENSGKITIGTSSSDGYDSFGVFAKAIDSIVNNGIMTIYNAGSYAIYAESGDTIKNTNLITLNNMNSTAIYGGEVSSVNNSGQIKFAKEGGIGIHTTGSGTIKNTSTITFDNGNQSYAIYAEGDANIENLSGGILTIGNALNTATDGYGIYAPYAASIKNNAPIYLYASGNAITGGDSIVNTASLNLRQNSSKGISSNGTSIENSGVIKFVNSGNNYGIFSTGAVDIINKESGEIIMGSALSSENNDYGIYALNSKSITNNAPITIYTSGSAITGGDGIVNNAQLSLFQSNSKGIYSGGNSVENNSLISISLPGGSYGIYSTGEASINNNINGTIILGNSTTTLTSGAYGIYAVNANVITNNALINVYATNSYGIDGNASSSIINNGNINLYNDRNTGIRSVGTATISNFKKINITGAQNSYGIRATSATITTDASSSIIIGSSDISGYNGNYGIYSLDGSISNGGDIYIYGGGYGISGQSVTSITNSGNIMLKNAGSVGIYTSSGNIVNNGFINMTGSTATGIYSTGSGQITTGSSSTINLISGSAIYATRNTPVVNNGIISISGSGYGINNASSVDNGGNITLGSGTIINANGAVTNSGNLIINGSGTAVKGTSLNNSGDIEIAEGTAISVTDEVKNTANIKVNGNGTVIEKALSLTNSGTLSVNSGTAINGVRTVNNKTGGTITTSSGTAISGASKIDNYGNIIGTTYAVDGGTELTNNSDSTISISSGTAAINGVTTVNNDGTIEVTGTATAAVLGATNVTNNGIIKINNGHGIYTTNPGSITNNGTITVSSGSGNGIYVVVPYVGSTVSIVNTGNISVVNGHAIYIVKNYQLNTEEVTEGSKIGIKYTDGTTVEPGPMGEDAVTYGGSCGEHCKNGEIEWTSSTASTSSLIAVSDISLYGSVSLVNLGQISLSGNIDFGSIENNSSVASIGKDGSYEADSFSGTVLADADLVKGGFDTVYVNENSFIGEDNGLSVLSQSYLFDASLETNSEGNLDIVMKMSSFEEKVDNSQIAQFLEQNYSAQKGEDMFNLLKSAGNSSQFSGYLNKELGLGLIPNFAEQSLDIEKTVNSELNDDLISVTNARDRNKINFITYKNDVDSQNDVSGYKDTVIAAYGFTDKAINNKFRLGFSVAAVRSDSEFDDNSSRYNNMLEISTPVVFNKENLSVLFKPKAGFARGNYRRADVNKSHKGKTKEFYYGFDSSVRNRLNLDYVLLEPNAGFNFTGLYNDNIKESNNGLKIKGDNTISAPVYLGIDIKKEFVFNKQNSLSLTAGGKYFHEFGKKDSRNATFDDMVGYYEITSNRFKRNYGLLSLKAAYSYNEFTISASALAPLKQKQNPYYMLNLGYNF